MILYIFLYLFIGSMITAAYLYFYPFTGKKYIWEGSTLHSVEYETYCVVSSLNVIFWPIVTPIYIVITFFEKIIEAGQRRAQRIQEEQEQERKRRRNG